MGSTRMRHDFSIEIRARESFSGFEKTGREQETGPEPGAGFLTSIAMGYRIFFIAGRSCHPKSPVITARNNISITAAG